MSAYLARLVSGPTYLSLREAMKQLAFNLRRADAQAQRAEEYARGFLTGGTLFEELGFYYVARSMGIICRTCCRCCAMCATPRTARCCCTSSPRRARAIRRPKPPPTSITASAASMW